MLNQAKNTKTIYATLHFEEQPFKMYTNEFKQDVIEWNDNKIVVGEHLITLNGCVEELGKVVEYIKATCEA
jgi:hypothetical protein